jgi:hypothetical protein
MTTLGRDGVSTMNQTEALEWIDIALDSLDKHEMMALIRQSVDDFDGEFFEVLEEETRRHTKEGDGATSAQLHEIGRVIASIRQNRNEGL